MEIEQGVELSATEATSPADQASVEGQSTPVEAGESQEGQEVAAYQPDYKFKFYGKDGEMEEWARQFIKDKETEDRFRSLYAKSNGFDVLRERYQSRDSEYGELQGRYEELEGTAKQHSEALEEIRYLRDNDLAGFFQYCGVPPEKLIEHVERHLEYLQKPESERKELDRAREAQMRARDLEKENQRLQQERESHVSEAHVGEFKRLLDHPEVTDFAHRYDSLAGAKGAFAQAVIDYGDMMFHKTGDTVAPLEAIRAVYRQYKPFVNSRSGAESGVEAPSREGASSAEATPAPQARPATIPNLGSGAATSPTRKVFSSLEELKKHVKAATAAED